MVIEELEKCFGTKAMEKGFVTFDQLMRALEIQRSEYIEWNGNRPIGMILFDMGLVTLSQIEEVLASMLLSDSS
jgi:hypothetical protein